MKGQKNKKTIFIVVVVLAILLLIGAGIYSVYKTNTEDKPKEEKMPVIEDLVKDGLEFKNLKITEPEKGMFNLLVELVNNSDKDIELEVINVVLYDDNGEEVVTLPYLAGTILKVGETHLINTNVDLDISKVVKVDYNFADEIVDGHEEVEIEEPVEPESPDTNVQPEPGDEIED